MIENTYITALTANAAVAAIIGTRCYAERAPQRTAGTAPLSHIVVDVLNDDQFHTLVGPVRDMAGRVQVSCFAGTYHGARDLAAKARAALDDGALHGGVRITAHDETPLYNESEGSEAPTMYGRALDTDYLS